MTQKPQPPPTSEVDALRTRLRADLTAAMKARRPAAVSALRSALATIDNAEAVEETGAPAAPSSAHIAGATAGAGSSDARRRALSLGEALALVRTEVEGRLAEADRYDALGRPEEALRLRDEAEALRGHLVP